MTAAAVVTPAEWEHRLTDLVDALVARRDLRSPAWNAAFAATPRHLFTPRVITRTDRGYRELSRDEPTDRDAWLALVYSDSSLVTQHRPHAAGYHLPGGEPLQVPTSSSTMPGLMARMLEALDVHDGMRVLEIGTGTGYNAALLAHRLGDRNVVSIDIDPDLVASASHHLAGLGQHPTLLVGDGTHGAPDHGPFDRIIATAAVPRSPPRGSGNSPPAGRSSLTSAATSPAPQCACSARTVTTLRWPGRSCRSAGTSCGFGPTRPTPTRLTSTPRLAPARTATARTERR